jgi:hypothetical protein
MGVVEGDSDPVLLELGTREECELLVDHFLMDEQYSEVYVLQVVQYTAYLQKGES